MAGRDPRCGRSKLYACFPIFSPCPPKKPGSSGDDNELLDPDSEPCASHAGTSIPDSPGRLIALLLSLLIFIRSLVLGPILLDAHHSFTYIS